MNEKLKLLGQNAALEFINRVDAKASRKSEENE